MGGEMLWSAKSTREDAAMFVADERRVLGRLVFRFLDSRMVSDLLGSRVC